MSDECRSTWLACCIAVISLVFFKTAAAAGDLLPELVPDPRLTADEVVRIQLEALANNDDPHPDAGIEITFRFASPDNRRLTGPLPRFIELVKNPVYGPMVNHTEAEYGNPVQREGRMMIPVLLTAENGGKAAYIFVVGQQTEECEGCWMTEAVFRIAVDQPTPGSSGVRELGV